MAPFAVAGWFISFWSLPIRDRELGVQEVVMAVGRIVSGLIIAACWGALVGLFIMAIAAVRTMAVKQASPHDGSASNATEPDQSQSFRFQFRLISAVFAVAVLAAVLAGLRQPETADVVRYLLLVALVVVPFFGAVYSGGRKQAFWFGFSLVVLMRVIRPLPSMVLVLREANNFSVLADALFRLLPQEIQRVPRAQPAIWGLCWVLVVALASAVGGAIAALLYRPKRSGRPTALVLDKRQPGGADSGALFGPPATARLAPPAG
jgi:hypothetical protein